MTVTFQSKDRIVIRSAIIDNLVKMVYRPTHSDIEIEVFGTGFEAHTLITKDEAKSLIGFLKNIVDTTYDTHEPQT